MDKILNMLVWAVGFVTISVVMMYYIFQKGEVIEKQIQQNASREIVEQQQQEIEKLKNQLITSSISKQNAFSLKVSDLINRINFANKGISIIEDTEYYYIKIKRENDNITENVEINNTQSEVSLSYRLPKNPKYKGEKTEVDIFGVTIDGITLKSNQTETNLYISDNIDNYNKLLDENSNLIGFASDGFPIYYKYINNTEKNKIIEPKSSYQENEFGEFEYKEMSGDLDECNGFYSQTPEFPNGTYLYIINEGYPTIPSCVCGEVDKSFL